jgi:hypothetical protein
MSTIIVSPYIDPVDMNVHPTGISVYDVCFLIGRSMSTRGH